MPGYNSNLGSAIKRITDNLTVIKGDKKLLGTIATSLQASNINRIHNEGKAVDGNTIGQYSTKETYVNPDKSPVSFERTGKTGETEFKNGEPHKTRYFRGGYKELRNTTGRRIDKVDLNFTGKLSKEFVTEKDGDGYNVGFATKLSSDIAEGNENRFGKTIWGVSKQDEEAVQQLINNDINDKLNGRRSG